MKYCQACGAFYPDSNEYCEGPNGDKTDCQILRKLYAKHDRNITSTLQPVTTENRFCMYCNKVYNHGVVKCPICNLPTHPITESHLDDVPVLLSGTGAKPVWASEY